MDTFDKIAVKLVSLCLLLTFFHANGAEISQQPKQVASMVASPNACTLEPLEEVCQMTFHILWETPKSGDYCLYVDSEEQPLKCWKMMARGSISVEFSGHILEEYKLYHLQNSNTAVTITTVTVPISGTIKQRQRAQRRRRGFWRMF